MGNYEFIYDSKSYVLEAEMCNYFSISEEAPVDGVDVSDVLKLLKESEEVDFAVEYYDQPCGICKEGIKEKAKYFKFLEYHFYIFSKNNKYVISNISKEYENQTYNKMLKKGLVDNSYLVSVMVCLHCGDYSIEIEQCEV